MEPRSIQNLRPREVVDLARSRSKLQFAKAIDVPVLVVRVDDPDGEVGRALAEGALTQRERLEPTIGYDTIIGPATESARNLAMSSRIPRVFAAPQLLSRLMRGVHFVVPLCKKATGGKTFSERISVGRALNNDIVLRHPSVSKFHAWFECDENDVFYVADGSSKNGTTINRTPIPKATLTRLSPGDEVAFGEMDAVLCPPDVLWEAITGKA